MRISIWVYAYEDAMKKLGLIFLGMMAGIVLTIYVLEFGVIGSAKAQTGEVAQFDADTPTATLPLEGSGLVEQTPQPTQGEDELPSVDLESLAVAPAALPTPVPGETQVYFVPTDNDASATVIYLYNTDTVAHTVALRGFSYNGVLVYSLNINVGATSFLRLASDSIASAPPPSWATPAPVITNFTDFTYFASLSLPKGVKAEGYTLFNPGTGVIDPRTDQGAIPLRFSSDPASVFLPSVQSAP
jgi:hypothetical protein